MDNLCVIGPYWVVRLAAFSRPPHPVPAAPIPVSRPVGRAASWWVACRFRLRFRVGPCLPCPGSTRRPSSRPRPVPSTSTVSCAGRWRSARPTRGSSSCCSARRRPRPCRRRSAAATRWRSASAAARTVSRTCSGSRSAIPASSSRRPTRASTWSAGAATPSSRRRHVTPTGSSSRGARTVRRASVPSSRPVPGP